METKNVRKTVTTRCYWRDIPEQYRNDEGSVFYAKREWDGVGNVQWEQYAYFADDCWCLDGVITDEPSYA